MKNIKYVFLANSQNLKEIGEYPSKSNEAWLKETKMIFNGYCKNTSKKYEERNKVVGSDGNYYFTITPTDTFYIVLAHSEYPQRNVFQLIEEIQKENIHLLVDEKGELNKIGKQSLKNLIDNYQNDNTKISGVQKDIDDIKIEMKQNVNNLVNNLEDVENLKHKSDKIKDGSKEFGKKAGELKRLTCWQNCKWTIILSVLVIGVLLIIILPLTVGGSSSSGSTTTGTNSTRLLFEN
jgi:hypothetical protein